MPAELDTKTGLGRDVFEPSPSWPALLSPQHRSFVTSLVFPLNAVRWRTLPREIAALVTESSRMSFAAELFHFGNQPRKLDAEFFLLSPGEYELTVTPANKVSTAPLQRQKIRVEGPRVKVPLQLPSRQLCVVKLTTR